jgi:hypothetical protein
MKKIISNLLAAILLWFASCLIAHGDPPSGCCCLIQLVGSQLEDCSTTGEFQPVSVAPLETATVTLQFGTTLAGVQVVVQALDSGTLGFGGLARIDQDGNLSFPFRVGGQPGLYRLSVVAQMYNESTSVSLVKFQVPSPE